MVVETECAHCREAMHIEIDSRLNYRVRETGAEPLVFVPDINLHELDEPSIIDAF